MVLAIFRHFSRSVVGPATMIQLGITHEAKGRQQWNRFPIWEVSERAKNMWRSLNPRKTNITKHLNKNPWDWKHYTFSVDPGNFSIWTPATHWPMYGHVGSRRQSSAWKCSRIKVVCMFKEGRALRLWRWPKPEPLPSLASNCDLGVLKGSCLGLGGQHSGVKLSECKEDRAWGFGHCQSLGPFPHLLPVVTWEFWKVLAWDWVVNTVVWSFPNARRTGPEGLAIASPSAPSLTCSSCDLGVLKGSCLGLGGQMVWSFEKARRTGSSNFGYRQSLNPCHQLFLFWLQLLNDSCSGFGFKAVVWSFPNARRAQTPQTPRPLPSLVPVVTWEFWKVLASDWVVKWCEALRRQGGQGLQTLAIAKAWTPVINCSCSGFNYWTILARDLVSRRWCEAFRMQGGQGLRVWQPPKSASSLTCNQLWLGNSKRFSGVKLSESKGPEGFVGASKPAPSLSCSSCDLGILNDSCLGLGGQHGGVKLSECKEGRAWGFGNRQSQPLPSLAISCDLGILNDSVVWSYPKARGLRVLSLPASSGKECSMSGSECCHGWLTAKKQGRVNVFLGVKQSV